MNFKINRGTNISHWLSQNTNRGIERQAWFTQADVKRIAGWGMDHIRIPVDEEQMWTKDGQREEEAFALLRDVLEWCAAEKLKVIVDLHILRSHYFNDSKPSTLYSDEKEMQKFAWFWQDLSAFLGNWGNEFLAYELLNEAVAKDNADWNKVYPYPFKAIRQREPERTIILGSNKYNQWSTYPDLKIPEDDNLILTFHYYNPMFVTHYKAEWTPIGQYDGPINYPGVPVDDEHTYLFKLAKNPIPTDENRYFDIEVLRGNVSVPVKIAAKYGYKLYCGEFGCVKYCPDDIRSRWYHDIRKVFQENDIAWANWDYKGAFGLLDRDTGQETIALHSLMAE